MPTEFQQKLILAIRQGFLDKYNVELAISDAEILRILATNKFKSLEAQNANFLEAHQNFLLRADVAMPTKEDISKEEYCEEEVSKTTSNPDENAIADIFKMIAAQYRTTYTKHTGETYNDTNQSIANIIVTLYPNGGEIDTDSIIDAMKRHQDGHIIIKPEQSAPTDLADLPLAEAIRHDEMPSHNLAFIFAYIAFCENGGMSEITLRLAKIILREADLTGDDIDAFEVMVHAIWGQI